ncbi:MAG: 4Fe-4S dicluster domain-containing protein [Bacillota bacterium]
MAIDANALDPTFKYEVASQPGAENIQACFTCGVCTACCPVSEIEPRYNPRKLIRMIAWGMRDELLSSDLIWQCNQCYNCYAHCPQNVKFTDVIGVLRRMAVKEGYAKPALPGTIDRVDRLIQQLRRDLVCEVFAAGEQDGDLEKMLARLIQERDGGESG